MKSQITRLIDDLRSDPSNADLRNQAIEGFTKMAESLNDLAIRWNETPEWHGSTPFDNGRIYTDTGTCRQAAEGFAILGIEPIQ